MIGQLPDFVFSLTLLNSDGAVRCSCLAGSGGVGSSTGDREPCRGCEMHLNKLWVRASDAAWRGSTCRFETGSLSLTMF